MSLTSDLKVLDYALMPRCICISIECFALARDTFKSGILPVTFAVALQLITVRFSCTRHVALILETACRRVRARHDATRISRVHANVRCCDFVNAYQNLLQ